MSNKNRHTNRFDDYNEEDDYRPNKKKDSPRRRPVRNWKKEWYSKALRHDEVDDFYSK
jgi:hypothetical protein